MMLARHAEDLFWAGRYIERAEDTARLLDVTYHGMLESPLLDPASAWRELLELLYLEQAFAAKGLPVTDSAVTEFLVLDPGNAGSIVRSVARARDNARNVRERISTELWEAINILFLELHARDLRADLEREPYQLQICEKPLPNDQRSLCGDDVSRRRLALPAARSDAGTSRDDLPPPLGPLRPFQPRGRSIRRSLLDRRSKVGLSL